MLRAPRSRHTFLRLIRIRPIPLLLAFVSAICWFAAAGATVAWSLIQNAPTGIAASESLGGLGVRLQIHDSVIRNTTKGILLTSLNSTPGGNDTVRVTLNRSNMANNTTAIDVESPPPGDARMTLDENVIQNNPTAINFNGGVVFSRGNNTMNFSTNGIVGGSLTAISGM